jgi:hypothetical protein
MIIIIIVIITVVTVMAVVLNIMLDMISFQDLSLKCSMVESDTNSSTSIA